MTSGAGELDEIMGARRNMRINPRLCRALAGMRRSPDGREQLTCDTENQQAADEKPLPHATMILPILCEIKAWRERIWNRLAPT
jgi:hypothetical protein